MPLKEAAQKYDQTESKKKNVPVTVFGVFTKESGRSG